MTSRRFVVCAGAMIFVLGALGGCTSRMTRSSADTIPMTTAGGALASTDRVGAAIYGSQPGAVAMLRDTSPRPQFASVPVDN